MKKLGIVGGTAWPSTVEYYASICGLSEARHREQGRANAFPTPEMTIESLDLCKALSLLGTVGDEPSWAGFDEYHRQALLRLAASGAEVAVLASNTPHYRFDAITAGVPIPVISIFDAVAAQCVHLGIDDVVILGTALTMETGVLASVLAGHGIDAFAPQTRERRVVIDVIERLQGGMIVGAASELSAIVDEAFAGRPARRRAVCLSCTELPLAFPAHRHELAFESGAMLFVNSTAVHARAAFEALLGGE